MSKKYKLLKDLPWAKAGSEWEEIGQNPPEHICLKPVPPTINTCLTKYEMFPLETFHDWFEEKKPEILFSPDQKKALLYYIFENRTKASCIGGEMWAIDEHDFERWLDAHTAKTEET